MTPRPAEALTPLVRHLPAAHRSADDDWTFFTLDSGIRLFVGTAPIDSDDLLIGKTKSGTTIVSSRSAAETCRAVITAPCGRVGIDIETLARIALNVSIDDDWLSTDDKALILESDDAVVELACHWMLKEAYGKALGVGLDLPLSTLNFHGDCGAIVMNHAPSDRWQFALYERAQVLFAVAHRLPI